MKKTCLCYCPFTGSFEQNFLIRNLIWQLALGEPMHLGELCVFTDSLVTLGRLQHFPFSHNWTHICFECFFSQEITARFRILFLKTSFYKKKSSYFSNPYSAWFSADRNRTLTRFRRGADRYVPSFNCSGNAVPCVQVLPPRAMVLAYNRTVLPPSFCFSHLLALLYT